jgi:hypothetical protein
MSIAIRKFIVATKTSLRIGRGDSSKNSVLASADETPTL